MTYAYAPQKTQKSPALGMEGGLGGGFAGLRELAAKGYAAAASALAPKDDAPAKSGGAASQASVPSGSLRLDVAAARHAAREWISRGFTEANALTDKVFYAMFPWLNGVKLAPKSPEAQAWLDVRDQACKPELAVKPDAPKPSGGGGGGAKGDDAATPQYHGDGSKAGTGDLYLNQNDNSYEDDLSSWKRSAGSATCNMTAVAMALVSIAGSEQVAKEAVAGYLRKRGLRKGADAKVAGKRVALSKVINDPGLLAKVQLEDLCIATGVELGGGFDAVTMTGTMLNVAKKSGLVSGGKAYASTEKMKDPAVLANAKQMLAEGKRVIVGTVNHYVYLTAVRDDGILVHDPAGARVSVSGDPKYLWPGAASSKLGHWDTGLKASLRATALRRVSFNPKVRACFEQEAAALDLKGDAKKAAREAVKAAHPGTLNTGENNFYGLDELDEYNCRIRVVLEPSEAQDDKQQTQG